MIEFEDFKSYILDQINCINVERNLKNNGIDISNLPHKLIMEDLFYYIMGDNFGYDKVQSILDYINGRPNITDLEYSEITVFPPNTISDLYNNLIEEE